MAKSKIADSDVVAYLQERKQSLQDELNKIEAALASFGTDVKSTEKKGKKKDKKKKLVKAIRKKIAKAIEDAEDTKAVPAKRGAKLPKSEATPEAIAVIAAAAEDPKKRQARRGRPATVKPGANLLDTAVATDAESGTTTVTKPKRTRTAKAAKSATVPPIVIVPSLPPIVAKKPREPFESSATMDEKIYYALGQKHDSTKAELIAYLNELEPSYGLTKLKKVVAFRLNYLLKTGQITGRESDSGFRYTI